MKTLILSSALVLGLTGAAFAQANFADVDADGNGGLSLTEIQTVIPSLTEEQFTAADADVNAELSADEVALMQATPAPSVPDAGTSAPDLSAPDAMAPAAPAP